MHSDATVYVVDDDAGVRDAIRKLISSIGLRVETFGSAGDFLASAQSAANGAASDGKSAGAARDDSESLGSRRPEAPACLILDVRLPDLSGLEFQRELGDRGIHIPIIFITGHGDVPMSVRAMKAGAVEFLTKPFRGQELLDAVQEAIAKDRIAMSERAQVAEVRSRYESLTAREKEVLHLVASGLLNKQVAAELGASELTIKTHRARVMQKMGAESLADLVRMSEKLNPSAHKAANRL
jgi:FixJ family two-component response regulator